MDFNAYECIEFHRQGRVLSVALNRPDQRNAVNRRLHMELSRVFATQRDPDSDVVILTGNGTAFCAGGASSGCSRTSTPRSSSAPRARAGHCLLSSTSKSP